MATKTKTKSKSKLNIRPLGDRVIVARDVAEDKTAGGILLPESAKDKPKQGNILAVGEGRKNDKGEIQPMNVSVGDNVLFSSYAGTEIKLDGGDYLIMSESDLLAIIG